MQELHAAMPTMDYCYLHAISGDCAAGGLVDQSQVIPIPNDKIAQMILRKYLRNQLEQDLCQDWDEFCELRDEHHTLGNRLIALGVFKNKWQKRTRWVLSESEAIGN